MTPFPDSAQNPGILLQHWEQRRLQRDLSPEAEFCFHLYQSLCSGGVALGLAPA